LIVIGGGVIGLEMGSVYQRFGTKVTVVEFFDRICPFMDIEMSKLFSKILTKQGMTILTGHKVTGGRNNEVFGEIFIENVKGGE
jgi:dihydrolipoamide dehydrogenase